MSTVQSLETYFKIRGISDEITLVHSGNLDWTLITDSVGEVFARDYSSALVFIRDSEVINIWASESRVPYNHSFAELIYSAAKFHRMIARHKAYCPECGEFYPRDQIIRTSGYTACKDCVQSNHSTHYIATAGLHGCLPNYCASHDDYESAVDDLASLHELGKTRTATLRRTGSLELNIHRDGNEYCEITECDCADPDCHNS